MQLLIAGDSFAADWTTEIPDGQGWVNLLADLYHVTNVAQSGCSEYRILKQIKTHFVLQHFDAVIVAHTSPYRVYTRQTPIQHKDHLHDHSDLIYADVEYHAGSLKNLLFNPALQSALGYFKHHYDQCYQEDIYILLRQEISRILSNTKVINIITPIVEPKFAVEKIKIEIPLQGFKIGSINHMDQESNQVIFDKICDELRK